MIQKSYKRHSQYKFICVFASHQLKEVIVCEALLEIGDEVPNTNLLENDVERLKKKRLATLGCGDDDEVDDYEMETVEDIDDNLRLSSAIDDYTTDESAIFSEADLEKRRQERKHCSINTRTGTTSAR